VFKAPALEQRPPLTSPNLGAVPVDDIDVVVVSHSPIVAPSCFGERFSITAKQEGKRTVIVAVGEFDLAATPHFIACADTALHSTPSLVVDLAGVSLIDSAGLHALVALVGVGGEVVIRGPNERVRNLLRHSGVAEVMPIEVVE
jgi:anti-anti-sigma factor